LTDSASWSASARQDLAQGGLDLDIHRLDMGSYCGNMVGAGRAPGLAHFSPAPSRRVGRVEPGRKAGIIRLIPLHRDTMQSNDWTQPCRLVYLWRCPQNRIEKDLLDALEAADDWLGQVQASASPGQGLEGRGLPPRLLRAVVQAGGGLCELAGTARPSKQPPWTLRSWHRPEPPARALDAAAPLPKPCRALKVACCPGGWFWYQGSKDGQEGCQLTLLHYQGGEISDPRSLLPQQLLCPVGVPPCPRATWRSAPRAPRGDAQPGRNVGGRPAPCGGYYLAVSKDRA
jgi:hypothetical protein